VQVAAAEQKRSSASASACALAHPQLRQEPAQSVPLEKETDQRVNMVYANSIHQAA
jgi:hypothetical protein